jgi:ArsR family transcriptional regulator, arsenate/arsenite/antimonite-responsive transcriptional repressor
MSIIKYNNIGGEDLDLIEVFKSLGDETRLRIIHLLSKEELCVCELETLLGLTQSNVSRHLNKLRISGIITYEKKSQWVYYRINCSFRKESKLLIEFIREKCENNPKFNRDIESLNKYKSSNFTCESLRDDKETVIKCLGGL